MDKKREAMNLQQKLYEMHERRVDLPLIAYPNYGGVVGMG